MADLNNVIEAGEEVLQKSMKKWEQVCKISNIVLSVLYVLCGWLFGFLGLMFFSLGLPDNPFTAFCSFSASLLFFLTPVFCILGIVLSVIFRKKKSFSASFMIQFLPFCTLGGALVLFFISNI